MKKNKVKINIVLILLSIIIIITVFYPLNSDYLISKGKLDLKKENIEKKVIDLSGEWEFYEGKLLNKINFIDNEKNLNPTFVNVPHTWENTKNNEINFATYRLHLDSKEIYDGIYIKYMSTQYRVFIDDELIASNWDIENQEKSQYKNMIIEYPGIGKSVDIIVQVNNSINYKNGFWQKMYIGDYNELLKNKNREIFITSSIFGVSIILIIILLILTIYGGRRKNDEYLFLAIIAIVIRTLVKDDLLISELIPNITAIGVIYIQRISFICIVEFIMMSLYQNIKTEFSNYFKIIASAINAVFIFLMFFLNIVNYTNILQYYNYSIIIVAVISFLYYLRLYSNKLIKDIDENMIVFGLIIAFIGVHDILIFENILNNNFGYLFQYLVVILLIIIFLRKSHDYLNNKIELQRLDNEVNLKINNMSRFKETIIAISEIKDIDKLEEEEFAIKVFRILIRTVEKANAGSVYLSRAGYVYFIDSLGHNKEKLNEFKYKVNDFTFPCENVELIKNINEDIINNETGESIVPIKESIVIGMSDEDEIFGAISLDISVNSSNNFDDDDIAIAQTISSVINGYYRNLKYQKVKEHLMNIERRKLNEKVNMDELTKLFNKRYFYKIYENTYIRMQLIKQNISILMIDIDNFKNYNDTYGHLEGDECLKKVSSVLLKNTREQDIPIRYGGEEFIIILQKTDKESSMMIAEKLRKKVRELNIVNDVDGTKKYITISIGVSTVMATSEIERMRLIEIADKALYESKDNGRNQVTFKDCLYLQEDLNG